MDRLRRFAVGSNPCVAFAGVLRRANARANDHSAITIPSATISAPVVSIASRRHCTDAWTARSAASKLAP